MLRAMLRGAGATLSLVLAGGGCSRSLPPLPQAFVVVDTDLPVPQVISRARIDLYAEDGHWFDSRDVALPDPRDWPTSFLVYNDDESREPLVWVRVRVYPDGRRRPYLGERRLDWSAPFTVPAGSNQPRLVQGGFDVTPPEEPEPLDTVDRVVRMHLRADAQSSTFVLLRGACTGTMPDLDGLPSGSASSCVDQEKTLSPVDEDAPSSDRRIDPSQSGTWLATPCVPPTSSDRICVPGGGTLIGSEDHGLVVPGSPEKDARPMRVYGVTTFLIDRTEVTVGRLRKALGEGLAITRPIANDGPITTVKDYSDPGGCTWSETAMGREDLPVACITWKDARAFCQHEGGDLPTEVQWEHVASLAGRPQKTRYPWGNDAPSCERAATSRWIPGIQVECQAYGPGPDAVTSHPDDATPLGVLNLGGGVAEWVRDTYADYTGSCWAGVSIADPVCSSSDPARSWRGPSWLTTTAWNTYRFGLTRDGAPNLTGFRCAYEVNP
jgi:formylglycine-generating enzyme required for sulfatase activity